VKRRSLLQRIAALASIGRRALSNQANVEQLRARRTFKVSRQCRRPEHLPAREQRRGGCRRLTPEMERKETIRCRVVKAARMGPATPTNTPVGQQSCGRLPP
jgi:hypothetical protein